MLVQRLSYIYDSHYHAAGITAQSNHSMEYLGYAGHASYLVCLVRRQLSARVGSLKIVRSIIAYIACIMAFMWRVRHSHPIQEIGPRSDLAFRLFICWVFAIGVVYAVLIISTLWRYGSKMDESWSNRIAGFRNSPRSGKRPKSPCVDVVSPTPPRSPTPQSPIATAGSQPVIPPRPAMRPQSTTSRTESSSSLPSLASSLEAVPTSPIILSVVHIPPEPVDSTDTAAQGTLGTNIPPVLTSDQGAGLRLGLERTRLLSERLPPLTNNDGPSQIQTTNRVQEDLEDPQRSNIKPVPGKPEPHTIEQEVNNVGEISEHQYTSNPRNVLSSHRQQNDTVSTSAMIKHEPSR